ncbi:MAG: hypothetical protein OMM_04290 [Candidatus Magnetoglobus multicellularis str. Araruama]|uniref:Uncharacterized protein n=1 Tax=Candidatus Magnetoglobus multicellularis str. Araruama TaxID=890399 RepID=A0A1V1P243_9BACT|nr:MAG: hypothetical protein OMM_04290 [Candidatus Magnetoglobus multicellularis str. Araruama]
MQISLPHTGCSFKNIDFNVRFEQLSNDPKSQQYVYSNYDKLEWIHIIGTFSTDSKELKLYKNAILVDQTVYSTCIVESIILNTNNELKGSIGQRYNGNDNFDGFLDDIRIYNRELSESEIKTLYELQPDTLSVTPTYKEVLSTTGTTTFKVTSKQSWKASTTTPWLTILINNNTITASYEKNTGEARTGKITVTAEGASSSPQIIEVRQSQADNNNNPTANNQEITTNTNTALNITLTATDIDGDPLTFEIVQSPSNGTFSNTPPNLTYTPDANYQGTDSFTFKANDGKEDSNIGIVSINVKPVLTESHFEEVDGNPADATWTIYLSAATLDGIDLQRNDEIAVFDHDTLVGSFKLTEILTQENQMNSYVTAWSTLSDDEGYNAGNSYTFKCWDASEGKEYICANPVFDTSYDDLYSGNLFPEDMLTVSIVSLPFVTIIKQTIDMSYGYQFVSLNVQPEKIEMTEVLLNILDELDFVKDSKSNILRKNWSKLDKQH